MFSDFIKKNKNQYKKIVNPGKTYICSFFSFITIGFYRIELLKCNYF
jgi:hypothetical protein